MMQSPLMDAFGAHAMQARVAGRTHPGQRRSENQDTFLISDLSGQVAGVTLRPESAASAPAGDACFDVGEHGALLVVADGMGGAAAGRLASGLACTFVLAELQEEWAVDENPTPQQFARRLGQAVEKANTRIHQHAQRNAETTGMGSTITAAGVMEGQLFIAQVGDSRAYYVRNGTITQITRDQSLVQQMIDAGAMKPEEAERSAHGNIILQALGVKPVVEVDLTSQQVRRDDYLLLCSDGLHRVVSPGEMAESVGRLGSPHLVCEELVDLANERGGPDNVTVVCAHFAGTALEVAQPSDIVARAQYGTTDPG
jgi:PPM family protein phosphatase